MAHSAHSEWLILIIVFNGLQLWQFSDGLENDCYESGLLSKQITGYQQFAVSYNLSIQPPAYH